MKNFLQDKAAVQSVKLGLFFTVLLTSFMSFQNIITQVYTQQGYDAVGPIVLGVSYLTFLFANSFAVKCKYSFKSQLLFASICYIFNMSIGIYVTYIPSTILVYIIVVFGASVGGASGGFLWVSAGGYLRQILKQRQNKGKYNAMFSFLVSFASITAGLTTTFFFGFFQNQVYFIALTTLSITSYIYGVLFLQKIYPTPQVKSSQQQSKTQSGTLIQQNDTRQDLHNQSILTSENDQNKNSQSTAIQPKKIRTQIVIDEQNTVQGHLSPGQKLIQFFKQQKKNYVLMKFVLIFFLVDGFCLGIQSNQMPKLIPDQMRADQQTIKLKEGILTIFLGVGAIAGSYTNGPICDKLGLKFAGKFTIITFVSTCVLSFIGDCFKAYWLVCGISFLWGFTYYLFEGFIYVSILKLFQGKLEGFATNKQIHCFSMAGFQIFVGMTKNKLQVKWLMMMVVLLAIPLWLCLMQIDFKNQKFGNKIKKNPLQEQQSQNQVPFIQNKE